MKTIIAITSIILLSLLTGSTASARGMMPPPPPFTGGNIGDWIGDGGSGPMFGSDDPWGKDFPDEWGGGGGGAYDDGGYGGYFRPDGPKQDTLGINFGCNRCQHATMTGGCRDICACKGWAGIITENPELGTCGPGFVSDERNLCGFHGGGCWHYK